MAAVRNRRIAYSQNFLRSPRLADRLIDRAGIAADDLVIEIGPGRGIITGRLAARCRQVLAVEKDPLLVNDLRGRFADAQNVALFAADFLTFPLPMTSYKVFANIPFNSTAAIVSKLTSGAAPPDDAFLAVQREAAERFLGRPRQTLVAVLLHPWFEPSVAHAFRPGDFAPAPRVDVILLRLRRRGEPLINPAEAAFFGDLTTWLFSAWRPTIREALGTIMPKRRVTRIEREIGHSLALPPSGLPFPAWVDLSRAVIDDADERVMRVQGARERLERQQAGLQKEHRTRTRRGAGQLGCLEDQGRGR